MGTSLHSYLEAAERVGRAPIDPRQVLTPAQAGETDDNQLLIVTTGSQVCAQLSKPSRMALRPAEPHCAQAAHRAACSATVTCSRSVPWSQIWRAGAGSTFPVWTGPRAQLAAAR